MLSPGPIHLTADDCDVIVLGLERLLAHWWEHPDAARLAGVDVLRVQGACRAIAERGLIIPAEEGDRGD